MNKPLKQSVRDHLDSYSLSEEQLNKLESLAEQNKAVTKHRVSIYPFTIAGAVAAFLLPKPQLPEVPLKLWSAANW